MRTHIDLKFCHFCLQYFWSLGPNKNLYKNNQGLMFSLTSLHSQRMFCILQGFQKIPKKYQFFASSNRDNNNIERKNISFGPEKWKEIRALFLYHVKHNRVIFRNIRILSLTIMKNLLLGAQAFALPKNYWITVVAIVTIVTRTSESEQKRLH